ncbi:hypothetical protein I4U23_027191 [Adineta vaga]|nr:hypothetical protein I4U23_027191 [Adineta vaga]
MVQGLSYRIDMNNNSGGIQQHRQLSSCSYHSPSPYKINELWSLQNAFLYGFQNKPQAEDVEDYVGMNKHEGDVCESKICSNIEPFNDEVYGFVDKLFICMVVKLQFGLTVPQFVEHELPSSSSSDEESSSISSDAVNSFTIINEDIRLCTITRKHARDIYGFDIIANKNELYHSLKILSNQDRQPSNAALAGLKTGDRLVEINDENIDLLVIDEIVQIISETKYPQPLKLLVANAETYNYYRQQNKQIHSKLPNIKKLPNCLQQNLQFNRKIDEIKPTFSTKRISSVSNKSISQNNTPSCSISSYQRQIPVIQRHHSIPSIFSHTRKLSNSSINICKGDLITQNSDVIVVCSSSQYLFDSICQAGGNNVITAYNTEANKGSRSSLISIKADGKLASKRVYFIPWTAHVASSVLVQSMEKFVSLAIEKAAEENYSSIAFPAIGCGQFGCSVDLIAQTMVGEAYRQSLKRNINISFVIQPERTDVYNEINKQIDLIETQTSEVKSIAVGSGVIEVVKGDITKQKVDVIIGSSSSGILIQSILKAAGLSVERVYNTELQNHPNAILIETPGGFLHCKRIFMVKWEPNSNTEILQYSLMDLISTVIQATNSHKFTSIAFPAIGCGNLACSVDLVVETMVYEMKKCLIQRKLSWTVKFIVEPNQQNIYDEFWTQISKRQDGLHNASQVYKLPSTWEISKDSEMRFELSPNSSEYKSIKEKFEQSITNLSKEIIRIERIQNERWYMQYLAHSEDFKKRLNIDTEKRLFHGCPENAANSIVAECFDRSFAGAHATLYGVGAYFSSNAAFSHTYSGANSNGERRMFLARVLIGKTTIGNGLMKTRPLGFDSTTDGNHIFVTYHDAQAYAEYLITYK